MRRSQARASSSPPPSAAPFIAARNTWGASSMARSVRPWNLPGPMRNANASSSVGGGDVVPLFVAARGGADGVGRATTNTVVLASILILVSDFFLTKLFSFL